MRSAAFWSASRELAWRKRGEANISPEQNSDQEILASRIDGRRPSLVHKLFPLQQQITENSQAPLEGGAWHTFLLIIELQAKLDRARLVALRANFSKRGIAPVPVGIAEIGTVKDIAELGLEPHVQAFF